MSVEDDIRRLTAGLQGETPTLQIGTTTSGGMFSYHVDKDNHGFWDIKDNYANASLLPYFRIIGGDLSHAQMLEDALVGMVNGSGASTALSSFMQQQAGVVPDPSVPAGTQSYILIMIDPNLGAGQGGLTIRPSPYVVDPPLGSSGLIDNLGVNGNNSNNLADGTTRANTDADAVIKLSPTININGVERNLLSPSNRDRALIDGVVQGYGMAGREAYLSLMVTHEFRHLFLRALDSQTGQWGGHQDIYQRLLNGAADLEAKIIESDVLADPVEAEAINIGKQRGWITDEAKYIAWRIKSHQQRLDSEKIKTAGQLQQRNSPLKNSGSKFVAAVESDGSIAIQEFVDIVGDGLFELDTSDLLGSLGSVLGKHIAGDNPVAQIVVSAGLQNILVRLGNFLEENGAPSAPSAEGGLSDELSAVVEPNLLQSLKAQGVGAVSSYLMGELVASLGIEGFAGKAITSIGGQTITQIALNLANPTPTAWNANIGSAFFVNAIGSFLGAQLAFEVGNFDTLEGQIGAQVGALYGSIRAAAVLKANAAWALANPVLAVAVVIAIVFLDTLLGGFIGSIFGGAPRSGADVAWNGQVFAVRNSWSRNGGSRQTAEALAGSVAETLNSVIGTAGATISNPYAVRLGTYGMEKKKFVYRTQGGPTNEFAASFDDAEDLVNYGQFIAFTDLAGQLLGGDVYIKRAIAATLAQSGGSGTSAGEFSIKALLGNISIAQDYQKYLQSNGLIDGIMTAEPESAFALGWLVTLSKVLDLGLNKRASTDWNGGWAAYLDYTLDGKVDGNAFAPANISPILGSESKGRLLSFSDSEGNIIGVAGDTILAADKTLVSGTSGNDTITVSGDTISVTTGLTIDGAAADGSARKIDVAAVIEGGDGSDTIRGGDLGNDLLGGAGDDTLVGGKLDDWLIGGDGDDKLFAGEVSNTGFDPTSIVQTDVDVLNAAGNADGGSGNYLEGGAGADKLYGAKGSDWLAGGAGADRLHGGAGGDILDGGAGNDAMLGGSGTDQYVFRLGDGVDTLEDREIGTEGLGLMERYQSIALATIQRNWAGTGDYTVDGNVRGGVDAISFGAGVNMTNLHLVRSGTAQNPGNDLIIKLVQWDANFETPTFTGDELTLTDWYNDYRKVEWLRFADGEEIRIADLGSTVIGSGGSDHIVGTNGRDFLYGLGGNDSIRSLAGDDFGYGGGGDDFITGDSGGDAILGGLGNDRVLGNAGDDSLSGDNGDDNVYGGEDDDIVSGGKGDDLVIGGAGNDIFKFAEGDGHDTVMDDYADQWEVVAVTGPGGGYQNDYILNPDGTVTKNGVTYFDGANWVGVYTYDFSTLTLRRFWGTGVISRDAGDDTIEFAAGINIQDVQLKRQGNDLVMAIAQDENDARSFGQLQDSVALKDYFIIPGAIEKLAFASTGVHDFSEWTANGDATDGNDSITGGSGKDWITGLTGEDTIDGGANADILSGNAGADTVKGGAGDDVIYGGADNDVLDGGAGGDQLLGGGAVDTASYESATWSVRASLAHTDTANAGDARGDVYTSIEDLRGTAQGDTLIGDDGGNTLTGAGGGDTLRGGLGDDAYAYKLGDGNDLINETGISGTVELVNFGGELIAGFSKLWEVIDTLDVSGVTYYRYRLTVTEDATGTVIYQSNLGNFNYTSPSQPVPSDQNAGAWAADDGQWKAGAQRSGNNLQVVRVLDGSAGGDDAILLDDASFSDIGATRSGANLVLSVGSGQITIQNQTVTATAVESLTVMDGVTVSLANLKLAGETVTADDDFVLGTASADTLGGGDGHDVISGGGGDDTLSGGAGDDSLEGGAGADTLDGGSNSTSIQGSKAFGDTIRYIRSAAVSIDLAALTASGGDAAGDVIVGVSGVSTVENVTGSEAGGDTLSGDSRGNRLFGLGGDDVLTGRGGDDVLIGGVGNDNLDGGDDADNITGDAGSDALSGGAGNDILAGGSGDDVLSAGAGADILNGGDGVDALTGGADNDTVTGDAGADTLHGDAGDDAVSGGEGADTLYGDDGNDVLSGDAGNDALQGGADDDVYVFATGWGQDVISDTAGVNHIQMIDVAHDKLWLVQSGNDLVISVIGSSDRIKVTGYFAGSSPSLLRSIQTADKVLFLAHAGSLLSAMTTAGLVTPDEMPETIAGTLATYWHTGNKAAPRVVDQEITANEDVVITGNVGAIDHDDNITGYTVVTDAAHGDLVLNAATGAWTYTPDANYHGADSFQVKVTDADQQSVTKTVQITLTSMDDAPSDIVPDRALVTDENLAAGAVVANFAAVDPDGAPFTFTLTDNPGNIFQLSASGQLTIAVPLDFEVAAARSITVRVQDQTNRVFTKTFSIGVTDINEAPTHLNFANPQTIAENNATGARIKVADLFLADDALGTETYTLSGADAGDFEIDNGVLYLRAGVGLNFESKSQYNMTVTADDASIGAPGTAELSQNFTFQVGDVNETPTITNTLDGGFILGNIDENMAGVINSGANGASPLVFTAEDPDTLTAAYRNFYYELAGGDASKFSIVHSGAGAGTISMVSGQDYEAGQYYTTTVRVWDAGPNGGNSITQQVKILIKDVNEAPYNLTFTNATTSIAENSSTASRIEVAILGYSDDALGTESYGLAGTDAAAFEIDGNRLYLKAGVGLNYEAKASYSVNVTVDDSTLGAPGAVEISEVFTLSVIDINETPTITNPLDNGYIVGNMDENAAGVVKSGASGSADLVIAASDPDISPEYKDLFFELVGGDAAKFSIVNIGANAGRISLLEGQDYEAGQYYTTTVRVWDSGQNDGNVVSQQVKILINDVNEAPYNLTFTGTTDSVAENTSTASRLQVATLGYSDDALGSESYGLAGADAASFEIEGNTLYLKAGVVRNHEAKSSYSVNVTVDDAALGAPGVAEISQTFTLAVSDVNEAPTDISLGSAVSSVAERDRPDAGVTPPLIQLGLLSGTDPDTAGSDFANLAFYVSDDRFEIVNGNQLRLKAGVMSGIDFEAGATLSVDVTVKDRAGAGLSYSETLTFAITDQIDYQNGTAGDDLLVGQINRDILRGYGGADLLSGGVGDDDLFGGLGDDTLLGHFGNDVLRGEEGIDSLYGEGNDDQLHGGDGNDGLSGGAGNDVINGDAGDDLIDGGSGADVIDGGAGYNTLTFIGTGGIINVNLATGTGTGSDAQGDTISNIQYLIGSNNGDTLTGSTANERIDGAAGNDIITGGGGNDTLNGDGHNDTVTGGDGVDTITGGDGNDILFGGSGTDTLDGGAGDDQLDAGGDGDVLVGGTGSDRLTGGAGSDTYQFDRDSGVDEIHMYGSLPTDEDWANFLGGIDPAELWFQQSGNDLVISVIGGTTSVAVKGWYGAGHNGMKLRGVGTFERANLDVEGLAALMAPYTKPASLAAHQAMLAPSTYASNWASLWVVNNAPTLGAIADRTLNEDTLGTTIQLSASDDFTAASALTYQLLFFDNPGRTTGQIATSSVIKPAYSVNSSQVLSFDLQDNVSGVFYAQLKVTDLTGRSTTRDFTLNVTPVADEPSLTVPASISTTLDGTGYLDFGALGFPISAALGDSDGSEALTLTIVDLPDGLSLNRGSKVGGVWHLTGADLSGLRITGPGTWYQDFTLKVQAKATETANGANLSSAEKTIAVNINARPTAITGSLSINENATGSSGTLTGSDPDGDTLIYDLTNNAGGLFTINGSGQVSLTSARDFETQPTSYNITARVTDPSGLSKEQNFTVTINDVNEAPTVHSTSYTIPEGVYGAGTGITWVYTSDPDSGTWGNRTLEIVQGVGDWTAFSLLQSGQHSLIRTQSNYDFETKSSYAFKVRATDGGGLSHEEWQYINISNVNEAPANLTFVNVPYPNSSSPLYETNTTTSAHIRILDLSYWDDALGSESYSLSGADAGWFFVSGYGVYMHVGTMLNFESKPYFDFTVNVDDTTVGGTPDTSNNFRLHIGDVNEAPTVTSSGHAIAESYGSGTHFSWITGSDPDSGAWGTLTYSMRPEYGGDHGYFSVGSNGALYLAFNPNFEARSSYSFVVRATDGGGLYHDRWQTVTINDVNEAPTVTSTGHAIAESYGAGTHFSWITGYDQDSGSNGTLTYTMRPEYGGDHGYFTVGSTGALYLAFNPNFEARSSYSFVVRATDGGGLYHDRWQTVTINDVNEAPTVTSQNHSIAESYGSGTHFSWITGSDPDSGSNGTLTYSMRPEYGGDHGYFSVGSTGALYLAFNPNFEARSSYSFVVRATDGGGLTYDRWQTVYINDVNEAPTVTSQNHSVAESYGSGTHFSWITGSDPDSGSNGTLTYSMRPEYGGDHGYFSVGSTGALYLAFNPNFESRSSYSFVVRATDGGGLTYDRWQTVYINDVNEAPTVTSQNHSIAESYGSGTHFSWITGSDPDGGSNGTLTYSMRPEYGGDHGYFSVGSTGALYLAFNPDYEYRTSYSFVVRATDGGGLAYDRWQTVYINNVNESPYFHVGSYSASPSEASPGSGQTTWTIGASDPESSTLSYWLSDTFGGTFSVARNPSNGYATISLQGTLDRESVPSYNFTLYASDGTHTTSIPVSFTVADVNEAPYFTGFSVEYRGTYTFGTSGFDPGYEDYYWAYLSFADPEGSSVTPYEMPQGWLLPYANGSYFVDFSAFYGDTQGHNGSRGWDIRAYDPQGNYVNVGFYHYDQGTGYSSFYQTPIVLDLDGDGVELVSGMPASVWFDMDGDGHRDRTGWVGADDGILAIDRDGDGVIGTGDEISFTRDTDAAVSDLEGLRSYDTNANGFVESGDAQFADLLVWRDANQDGVSQAGELVSLSQLGITAINLTLTTTGQTVENADDNVVYGTSQFVRADGTTGTVGDVSLYYTRNHLLVTIGGITQDVYLPDPGQLAPVVIDMDDDGVSLISRLQSNVRFDSDNDGIRQRTGWVDGGDGILALDRNQDGVIGSGSEISFKDDLAGAISDLEGLRAYDSNGNGLLEAGDVRFGEFLLWQDADQDGVSNSGELRSLADSGISAINLTLRTTGQAIAGATDNVLYATADVVMADGKRTTAGDVFLSFDQPAPEDDLSEGDDLPTRTPDSEPEPQPEDRQPTPFEPSWWDGMSDGPMRRRQETVWDAVADDAESNFRAPGRSAHNIFSQDVLNPGRGSDWRTSLAQAHGIGGVSPVDLGLGLLEQQMLQMVAAMASFDPAGFDDGEPSPGQRRLEQGSQFLTAVPRFSNNNSPHVI